MRPNIILLLADDMGWGQVGYNGHPRLTTPNINALAANGLRFDRFYSSGPFCSPTRAAILTGRTGDRCGVHRPFYRLRIQEKSFVKALKSSGYETGHFGKWHLSGLRGSPGAPVVPEDTHGPAQFGFKKWVANTCNINPTTILGDDSGAFSETPNDSSADIADATNDFIDASVQAGKPFFANVWFSSPHAPFVALPQNKAMFEGMGLSESGENQHGMIVELDNAIGVIRQKLRDLNIENDTLVWFCSDNGGLPDVDPDAVGSLNGEKDTLYEGGLRVPCAVEWPTHIQPSITQQLAYTSDIASTLLGVAGVSNLNLLYPQDGESICAVLTDGAKIENRALAFHSWGRGALISDRWKIVTHDVRGDATWELYDLQTDTNETHDVAAHHQDKIAILSNKYWEWYSSVRQSVNGLDYPDGVVTDGYQIPPPH